MKRFDLKQMIICILALLSSRFSVAEVYPLVPAVFMTGFLSGVNRSLLFLCAIGGLVVLAPLPVLAEYGLVLILSALLVKWIEMVFERCRTPVAAILTGALTSGVSVLWWLSPMPSQGKVLIHVLEGVFVWGFICAATRLLFILMDWEPQVTDALPVYVQGSDRLNQYAKTFSHLSRTFQQMSHIKSDFSSEELERMHSEVTGGLCISCSRCAVCWDRENPPMYRILYRFLQSIVLGEHTEEASRELGAHCSNMDEMIRQVTRVFEMAHLNLSWYNRLLENRDAIAQQLDAMAYIMEDCANNEQDVTKAHSRMTGAIRYALKEMGVVCEELRILKKSKGKLEVRFLGKTAPNAHVSIREIAKEISRATRHPFIPARDSRTLLSDRGDRLCFKETSRMSAHYGVARAVRDGEQVSGDSFSFLITDSGNCVLCVSDGMGSGYSACKESEMVIDLIEKFMEAGFRPETALQMMNSAMVTHAGKDQFSTVDLAEIDLDTGNCGIYKIGAVPTFILHDGLIRWVDDNSMPVGVFMSQRPARQEVLLEDGDMVIMLTDGVMEHLDVNDPKTVVSDILRSAKTANPSKFAEYVLERILSMTEGRVRDDMTVLAAGIWEQ